MKIRECLCVRFRWKRCSQESFFISLAVNDFLILLQN